MQFFTTANNLYFEKNTRQLVSGFCKFSRHRLRIYSEDMSAFEGSDFSISRMKRLDEIKEFQIKFKKQYGARYQFLYYFQKMDVWILKIAAQLQHLEETESEVSIFIDSDSVITKKSFDETVAAFIEPFLSSDKSIALFRRFGTHLHTESGFLVLRKSPELIQAYHAMLEFILEGSFYVLASWTDCSVIDHFIDTGLISYFDFCESYSLRSTNPVYESPLRTSMLHLKGPRKGSYSMLKRIIGSYR